MQRWVTEEPQAPPLTEGILRLLVLFFLAFVLEAIAILGFQRPLSGLALSFGPEFNPTQILTHIFLNGAPTFGGVLTLLIEGLMLWVFGSEIERLWGPYHFLKLFLAGIAGAMVTSAAAGLTLMPGLSIAGAAPGLAAVLLTYAVLWPERRGLLLFMIPMKIRWLILVILILMAIPSLESVLQVSGGALGGALFLYYYIRKGNPTYTERVSESPGLMERWNEFRRKRRLEKKRREIERRIDLKDEVDRILDKISKTGMKSLSRKEKDLLDTASKEL
ncbi:MAG: rhomboid family intramembrane serine protease [Spirochaetia bacterium]|nr:rhomboid family intramembrane serine protease [Spirochaetia bacterium]